MSDKPELRVLQVFSALGMGGAETWLISLLKYFRENSDNLPYRVKFDICLTSGEKAHFDEQAKFLGANLHYIKYSRKTLLLFIKNYRKLLKEGGFHVIHDHQDYTAGWHFFFGLNNLPPIRVAHVHTSRIHIENYTSSFLRKMTVVVGNYFLRKIASHILGTSRQIITEYGFNNSSFGNVHLDVVHCGFDVDQFGKKYQASHDEICQEFGWKSDVKIILFVGRLDSITNGSINQKNPEFALDVMKECVLNDPLIRCIMIGKGGKVKSKLIKKLRKRSLEEKIKLTGERADISKFMVGSELLLLTSIREGLGMVVVEAQSAGLRVLASDTTPSECTVIPEMVSFLSLELDSVAWADRIRDLVSLNRPDHDQCNQLVKKSPFFIKNSAKSLLEIYTSAE